MNKQLVEFGELPQECEFSYIGYACKKVSSGVADFIHYSHDNIKMIQTEHFDCHALVTVSLHSRLELNYFA